MTSSVTRKDRILGSLFGAAIGDAMAAPLEFIWFPEIMARYPSRAEIPPGKRVTDDTQMMLAVGEAIIKAQEHLDPETLEREFRRAFVEWSQSPDNTRAPGMTCMAACGRLARGGSWLQATAGDSKGCGANMRVTPVGLLTHLDEETRSAIAQFQAAITHGHPTGILAADLTAQATYLFAVGTDPQRVVPLLQDYLDRHGRQYHQRWLSDVWKRPGIATIEQFLDRGREECLIRLEAVEAALRRRDLASDPCAATGQGWIAEEAFATGLLCFLLYPNDPVAAIRHASATQGDSDSIACLTGAFAGAAHGQSAWPADWVADIEYQDRLISLGGALAEL